MSTDDSTRGAAWSATSLVDHMHPLGGCIARLERAGEHFDLLQNEIEQRYAAGKHAFVKFEGAIDSTDRRWFRWYVASYEEPPPRWSTIVGDIVHNLRSVLDLLVFELAFLDTGGKADRQSFPVCQTRAAWTNALNSNSGVKGLNRRHQHMLYQLQPCYRRRDIASDKARARRVPNPFADLTNLWNTDKHRLLPLLLLHPIRIDYLIGDTPDCRVIDQKINRTIYGRPWAINDELVRHHIETLGPNPRVEMGFAVEAEVGLVDGIPIRERLARSARAVSAVVQGFMPEFETPRARSMWHLPRPTQLADAPLRAPKTWLQVWDVGSHDLSEEGYIG